MLVFMALAAILGALVVSTICSYFDRRDSVGRRHTWR